MSDDVITRAKASLGDYLSAPDTDRLIEDLIALAETQAAQLAAWADALNAADSILSLLHYRGIIDHDLNRRDVKAAMDKVTAITRAHGFLDLLDGNQP